MSEGTACLGLYKLRKDSVFCKIATVFNKLNFFK